MEKRQADSPQPKSKRTFSAPILATALYSLLILTFSVFASTQLFDWARNRIVNTSPLAGMEMLTASLQSNAPAVAPVAEDTAGVESADAAVTDSVEDPAALAMANMPSINILALGVDARPDDAGLPLTDTMLLISLDPASQSAGMLSLPRDLWVPIPHTDTTAKINTAYMLGESGGYPGGGPQTAKDTVGSFIGQPVQYYVRINFDGFVELVDLIGGVDVMVPEAIHDEAFPTLDYGVETFHLDGGLQHLDGETALKYVRTRNVDSDYGRARRQQQVIRAIADKVMRADMIPTLIAKAPRLLYTMRSSIETDMPMAQALDIANYFRTESLREVRQLVLDSRYGEETYSDDGQWILLPDRTRVRAALNSFFAPTTLSGSVAQTDPSWVRVEILNGTGEPGVAAQAREMLQAQGWQVVSIGDADRNDYSHTLIVNYGIPESVIDQVGNDLELEPGLSTLEGLNTAAPIDMRIVVGRDMLGQLR